MPSHKTRNLVTESAIYMNGYLVNWSARKQSEVTKSTAIAELVAL